MHQIKRFIHISSLCLLLIAVCFGNLRADGVPAFVVSGTVSASDNNSGLQGVQVVLKGTQQGTLTDSEGRYSIEVPDEKAVLVFSYIGYDNQEITVGSQRTINLTLIETVQTLDDVIITALGLTRQERSIGYSVGKVDEEAINRVAQENVMNALSGKVAGVTVNSTGGTGSSVSMVIRGATSLSSDNQPLFVVNGVPIASTLNNVTEFGSRNVVDYGNAISDLNPNDIQSITVLKGPSAAALYGSRAGNGVVLITTKSGRETKGTEVSFSSNTVFDRPFRFFDVQTQFAPGFFSFTPDLLPSGSYFTINEAEATGSGMELDKGYFAVQWNSPLDANGARVPLELVSHPDNVKNFVKTGVTTTNSVSVSNNSERMTYRLGFTNMTHSGIVPNSDLFKNNLSLSSSFRATNKLTISTNVNVNRNWSNNRPSGNRGTNPLQWAYAVPQSTDIRDLEEYWVPGLEGIQQLTPNANVYNNPYFLAHEVNNSFSRDRVFGNVKAELALTPSISLMARYSLDKFSETRESKIGPSYTRERNNGAYGRQELGNYEQNIDFLATFNKQFGEFGLNVSGGGNYLYILGSSLTNSSKTSAGLIVPNVYSVGNISAAALNFRSIWSQKGIYSLYGLANLSYADMIYLDLTARNDWSSTLPVENQSYFYPSASLSLIVNEMFNMGKQIDLFKLRGGWAKVGNDADPYQLFPIYGDIGQWGNSIRLDKSGTILTPNLKPEESTSWEVGTDIRLFQNRVRIEATYYQVANRNQIIRNIPIASSSGFDRININAGLISSEGWEILFGITPIRTNNLRWDLDANFTRNRTTLDELADGIDLVQFWSDAKGGAWTYVGDQIGDIYDADIRRVEDESSPYFGYPILNQGSFEWDEIDVSDTKNRVGNYNPDFIMGLQNSLTYKNFRLAFTLDWRKGGQFISQTYRYMTESVSTQRWLDELIDPEGRTGQELRDWLVANEDEFIKNGFNVVGGPTKEMGGFPENFSGLTVHDGVFVPGVVEMPDGTFVENLGNNNPLPYVPYVISYPWEFASASLFDSDFIKLRDISLSYQVPKSAVDKVSFLSGLQLSVYSRNIVLWTKADIGVDPERAFQPEASTGNRGTQFKQGIERYNVEPWVVPIGFKVNLTF